MDLLKKIFSDDDQIVGLCAFKTSFTPAHKVYNSVSGFSAVKLVYSSSSLPKQRNANIFAYAANA